MKYAESVLDLIGNTPLVKLNSVTAGIRATVLAKIEFTNPGGSIKDRIAASLVAEAERSGKLQPGGTIVEPTSGNTGVGLAMVAAIRGYSSVFVAPDKVGQSKRDVLKAYGAEVVVTATNVAPDSPESYYGVSDRITSETPGAYKPNQFANQAGPAAHYDSTGPEIWHDTDGKVTHVVIGAGTGGTITGTGRYLHDVSEGRVKVIAADPAGSIYADHSAKLHGYYVEGVGEDMIPDTYDPSVPDGFVTVDDAASFEMTRRLAVEEGLLVGGSSGMAVVAALETAKDLDEDGVVVVVLPDSGRGYIDKIFNDQWMAEHGFTTSTTGDEDATAEASAGSAGAAAGGAASGATGTVAGLAAEGPAASAAEAPAASATAGTTVAQVLSDLGLTPGEYAHATPDTPVRDVLAALGGDVVLVADTGAATEFNLYGIIDREVLTGLALGELASASAGDGASAAGTSAAGNSAGGSASAAGGAGGDVTGDTAIGSLTAHLVKPQLIGACQTAEDLREKLRSERGVVVLDAGRPIALLDRTALARWATVRKDLP